MDDFLRQKYPLLDEWLHKLSTDPTKFGSRSAASGQPTQSTRHILRLEVEGHQALQKYDCPSRERTYDGGRDKVAADLAQLLHVFVPSALLWRDKFEFGCVQKEPPFAPYQTLRQFLDSLGVAPDDDEKDAITAAIANSYSALNVLFDIWVCNTDRATNYKNTLIVEPATGLGVWLVDYNNSLGHLERPWTNAYKSQHGFRDDDIPVPALLRNRSDFLSKVKGSIDAAEEVILSADDESIDHICNRAFGFYEEPSSPKIAKLTAECLKARKQKVKDWTCQLLKI